MHRLGWWGLVFLVASLGVTPLRRLTGWNRVIRWRRFLGLWAFAYLTSHFLTYLVLDQFFAWGFILEDIIERPFILSGFTAWLLLIPLAATSTKGWIRRLGKRWTRLHRLVYVSAVLGLLHFYWKVKADTREPLVFATIVLVLFILRVPIVRKFVEEKRRAWQRRRREGKGLRAT
jgi:sulfoxide reductase heme-binding subunit YedZ